MANTFDTTTKNAMLEIIETRMKAGSSHTNPRVCWYAGATLLVQVDLNPTEPFDPAATGAIVLNAVADATEWAALSITPEAAGTVDSVQLQNRDYTAIVTMDGANMGFTDEASKVLTTNTPLTFSAAPSWSI